MEKNFDITIPLLLRLKIIKKFPKNINFTNFTKKGCISLIIQKNLEFNLIFKKIHQIITNQTKLTYEFYLKMEKKYDNIKVNLGKELIKSISTNKQKYIKIMKYFKTIITNHKKIIYNANYLYKIAYKQLCRLEWAMDYTIPMERFINPTKMSIEEMIEYICDELEISMPIDLLCNRQLSCDQISILFQNITNIIIDKFHQSDSNSIKDSLPSIETNNIELWRIHIENCCKFIWHNT